MTSDDQGNAQAGDNALELEIRAVRALQVTWQAIGPDCFRANGGKAMTRDDVIDFVAGSGFCGGYPEMYGRDRVAILWLERQPEAVQDQVLQLAFPLDLYVM
jgi:hypothetical protein